MSVEPYPDLEIGDGKPIALSTQYADEDRICQAAWVTGITMREITQWVTDHLAGSAPQIPPELQETALQTLHVSVTTAPAWRVIDFTAGASLHVGDTPVYCRIQLQHSRHGERERFELTATVGLPLRGADDTWLYLGGTLMKDPAHGWALRLALDSPGGGVPLAALIAALDLPGLDELPLPDEKLTDARLLYRLKDNSLCLSLATSHMSLALAVL